MHKYSNVLDLRNKYCHGNNPIDEKVSESSYYQILKIMCLIIIKIKALHEFLWDSYLKLSLIFNWNAPSDPRCEDFFAGIVLAAIERASLG